MAWNYSFQEVALYDPGESGVAKSDFGTALRIAWRLTALQIRNTLEMRSCRFMGELFRDTYRYRELIWALALKELRVRYKRSVLGFLWALLNPALLMVVLTLVFGTIMRFSQPHYSIFLLSMLLPWTFFAQSLA